MAVVNTTFYKKIEQSRKASIYEKLEAVRDLKVEELNNWLDEMSKRISLIASHDGIRLVEETYGGKDPLQNEAILDSARDILNRYNKQYKTFLEILLINPHNGKIIVSTDKKNEGSDRLDDVYFTGALKGNGLFIKDIHKMNAISDTCMSFSVPVFNQTGTKSIAAILVTRIDLGISLYKLMLQRTGMGLTGETLIVNKDSIAMNELRWHDDAPMKLEIKSKSAYEASHGNTGIIETKDYRAEKVLAAYTYIPRTGWGFVAKQDIKEVFGSIYQIRNWAIIIGTFNIIGIILVGLFISRSISRPIKLLQKGSQIVGGGHLDYKIGGDEKDEIGELSRTFDQMTSNLRNATPQRDELEREITERKQAEKSLSESEERYRLQFNETLDAILISDAETGILVDCNQAATELVGREKSEMIGKHQNKFYPLGRESEVENSGILRQGEKGKKGEHLFAKIQHSDGKIKDVSIKANLFELNGKKYLQGIFRDITEYRKIEKALVEIEEYERHRLGYELHDGLGQLLAGISFKSRFLEDSLKERNVQEAEDAARITSLIDEAKEQVRLLARGKSPMEMDSEGFLNAFERLTENVEKNYNVTCLFQHEKTFTIYNKTAALHLYRIAQETITNIAKYGNPAHIRICISKESDIIEMTIEDDGSGISALSDSSKMGLKIMKYRAEIIGSSLEINVNSEGGVLLKCLFTDRPVGDKK